MAYIRSYRDGWRAEVQRNGQRRSKLFRTKREAQAWALEQEGKAKTLGKGWRTFGEAVEAFQKSRADRPSARWEANVLARLLAEFGEDTHIGAIDQPRIAEWRDRRKLTVTGSTIQREANLLRHLFIVARDEWKWIDEHPFRGVKLPAESRPRTAVWSWQLIKRVLRAPRVGKTAEAQRAFHIALRTGMRLSEVLAARLVGNVAVLPKDKTTDGPVKVPLTRHGRRLLGASAPFTVSPNEASVLFGKLCREVLIEGVNFHDARATALTMLARRVDVMTLAKISRHKDLRILQNTYYRETAEQVAARL